MFKEVVSPETAAQEVQRWLDVKRVTPKRREAMAFQIEMFESSVVYGMLTIQEDNSVIQKLLVPLENFADQLEFKPRIQVGQVQEVVKNQKIADTDGIGRNLATMSVLTGKSIGVLSKLDNEDMIIANSVTAFFL